jgi:hypothetical protein
MSTTPAVVVTKHDRPVVVVVMTAEKFERLTALDVSVQHIFRRHPPASFCTLCRMLETICAENNSGIFDAAVSAIWRGPLKADFLNGV